MAYVNPSWNDFVAQFTRDFQFGTDPNIAVVQNDFNNAVQATNIQMNPCLWMDQPSYTYGYLLLTAHNLVLNLRASSQGLNGSWDWARNNKAVGAVSVGLEIPQRIKDNPDFMQYYQTNYGAQYMNMLWPQLCGPVDFVWGRTKP